MNKSIQISLLALATSLAISAPAFAKDTKTTVATNDKVVINQLDSTQEVAYNCTTNGTQQKMTAMYGIKNGEIVVAQVKVNGIISKGLWRLPSSLMNVFESREADGTIWTTLPATPATLHSVDGGKLSVRKNGRNAIVLEQCKLDKAAKSSK